MPLITFSEDDITAYDVFLAWWNQEITQLDALNYLVELGWSRKQARYWLDRSTPHGVAY